MFDQLFESFQHIRVAVVGDVMLDTYWMGYADRLSPEAPVPVVALKSKEYRLGGAANVALNLLSLGAQVDMYAVMGNDEDGQQLALMMQENNIGTAGVLQVPNRITTNKIRVVSRSQHLLRIDHEVATDLEEPLEAQFIAQTMAAFAAKPPQVVIFEDYNKGVLTKNVIEALITYCRQHDILTTVDPKRKNFFAFKGVDVFKPNLKEVKEALNIIEKVGTLESLSRIHYLLQQQLQHHISFITLSELGVFVQQEEDALLLPAFIRNIADVSGAGDTVIAVASLVYAATKNRQLMAQVANLAGGIVCEQVGTVAISKTKLLAECNALIAP